MAESGKSQKTIDNIDKIIQQGQQFYQDTADSEGRGRFPGQGKFDMVVGGAGHQEQNNAGGAGEIGRAHV